MKRLTMLFSGIALLGMVLLVVSYGRVKRTHPPLGSPPPQADPDGLKFEPRATVALPLPVNAVSASGLPVTLSLAAVNTSSGVATCRVSNQSSETLSGIHLVLLKFNEARRLERVEGGIINLKLTPIASTEVSLNLKGGFSEKDRLFITAGTVYGTGTKWRVDTSALIQAIASSLFSSTVSLPAARKISDVEIADYGSVFCYQAFQQAMTPPSVPQTGVLGVTLFNCAQTDRTYEVSYGPVINKQP